MSRKSPTDPQVAETETTAASSSKTTTNTKAAKKKNARMSQERIDSLINYQSMYFPEDAIPRVSKERLAQTNLANKGDLPVPLDKYMEEEEVVAGAPPPGRRRFRPGVTKQPAGKTHKLN